MLYFAYGSNLNHFQMKKRCKDSKYIKKFEIKDFRLTFRSKYGVADIESKKNYSIQGGLYEISKSDEKKLDIFEDFPILYKKIYFGNDTQKIMAYSMVKKSLFIYPSKRYLDVIKQGYKDCKLDIKYLEKALRNF